ncbi:MAG: hypothetical protein WCJ33_08310, partial [Pseudomonadota bacterium]
GITLITALGAGGTLLLPITKWLEDRREKISAFFDKIAGKEVKEITPEAEQTWESLGKGRLVSWGTVYAIFIALGPNIVDFVQKKVGGFATNIFTSIFKNSDKEKVGKWADLAVFDLLFTAVSASITYIFSRKVAEHNMNKKESENKVQTDIVVTKSPETNIISEELPRTKKWSEQNKPSLNKIEKSENHIASVKSSKESLQNSFIG